MARAQYRPPKTANRGSNATKAATKGSPSINLKGASAQMRDPEVEGGYLKGKRVGTGRASAGIRKGSAKQNRNG